MTRDYVRSLDKPPAIDSSALKEAVGKFWEHPRDAAQAFRISEAYLYNLMSGKNIHPRQETRRMMRNALKKHLSQEEVDRIVPPMPDLAPKGGVLWIQGTNVDETRRLIKRAAAEVDSSMKDYLVTLFEDAKPSHPLLILQAARAAAERAGMRLDDWVRQQLNGA